MNEIVNEADRLEADGHPMGQLLRWCRLTIYEHVLQYETTPYLFTTGNGRFNLHTEGDGAGVGMGYAFYQPVVVDTRGDGFGGGLDIEACHRNTPDGYGMGYAENSGDGMGAGSPLALSLAIARFESNLHMYFATWSEGVNAITAFQLPRLRTDMEVKGEWRLTRDQGG